MLHQFKKNQMVTRNKKQSYIDEMERFIANAELAHKQAIETQAFIDDCIKHLEKNGSVSVFRKNIFSVCHNQTSNLSKLITIGDGLAEADKGFETPFGFLASLQKLKEINLNLNRLVDYTCRDIIVENNDYMEILKAEHFEFKAQRSSAS